jgi:hypothetical protein
MGSARALLLLAASASALTVMPAAAQTASTQAQIDELKRLILEQQRQIQALEERLRQSETSTTAARSVATEARDDAEAARRATAERPLIASKEKTASVVISGHANRMLMLADDGDKTKLYNVDNNNSSSRLNILASHTPDDGDLTVGAQIEVELESNASDEVSQLNEDTGAANFRDRIVEVFAKHKRYGTLRLGQGSAASDDTANVDLSGTTVVSTSAISDLAGGLLFFDDDADELSDVNIVDAFNNLDGNSRLDRIRYDTPSFAGFMLSGDISSNQRGSAAVRWERDLAGFSTEAALAWSDPGGDGDYIVDGSAAGLHLGTGLSLAIAAGTRDEEGRDNAQNYFAKLGWQTTGITEIGRTAFSLDYTRSEDVAQEGDTGDSIGLFGVQYVSAYATELFAGVRWHSLDRDDADFQDIIAGVTGARVKF